MEYEIIGFIDIKRSRRENEKSRATIPIADPESMFNEKDEPSRYHNGTLFTQNTPWLRSSNQRLAVRPESLPTAIMCVNVISQPW